MLQMDYFKKFPKRELHPPFSKLINEAVNNDFQSKSGRKPIQDYYYDNTCSIIHPKNNCITYAKAIKFLQKSNYKDENCIILVPTDLEKTPEFKEFKEKFSNVVFIGVKDPLVIFLDIHDYLHLDELPRQWFHKPKSLGNGIYVGENVEIGKNTIIYPGTVIYDNVKIGNNCLIHSNCSIGGDGFRFIQRDDGTLRKMIHISNPGVIIEDDVEIQSNCNVSRGVFDPTRIGKGTKIDALVHIAHNDGRSIRAAGRPHDPRREPDHA